MKKIKFFDTNVLLHNMEEVEAEEYFMLSTMTLKELENIKTSSRKDDDVKFQARRATRWLKENGDKFYCVPVTQDLFAIIDKLNLDMSNDNIIMACAKKIAESTDDNIQFITNDLCCYNMARDIFELDTTMSEDHVIQDEYSGYKETKMNNSELAKWYENPINMWELLDNEYLLIRDENDVIIDQYRYLKGEFLPIRAKNLSSMLGRFKPMDKYQLLAVDSLSHNKLTMLKGKPGSGKSLIAMNYLFNELEKGRIDQIMIFVNSPAVRGSVPLGFYKGTKNEKLLDSQIGSFLSCKLGGMSMVESFLEDNEEGEAKIVLMPMSDIRGIDLSGKRYGVLITEAQNTTVDLMKLAVQRVGEESFMIIDGDFKTQVDDRCYEGKNNGMRRLSEVFRGTEYYGEVELNKVYRSKIAEIADQM